MNEKDIVLIDGACALCNRSARFIIKNGGDKKFRFVALETKEAKKILEEHGFSGDYKDSVVLVKKDKILLKSDAMLNIFRNLTGFYPLVYALIIIPRVIRDGIYAFLAKHRYVF